MKMIRQEKLYDYINKKGATPIDELVEVLKVSKSTVVRDVNEMEKEGKVVKLHGGVKPVTEDLSYEPQYLDKMNSNSEIKKKIAQEAMAYILDNSTIILASGTTTMAIAELISESKHFTNITIITNDLQIAYRLASVKHVSLFIMGGQLRQDVYSIVSPFSASVLEYLNADIFFCSADAVDFTVGVTNNESLEALVKKQMIDISKKTILVADKTKFNKIKLIKVCSMDKLDIVITNYPIDKKIREELPEPLEWIEV